MPDNTSSNKRIAKNTLLLYLRMFYSLIISLFTARVILNALGVEDYGLYNVIGSIVSMFVFLRSAMGNSVHRYITFSIGKGNYDDVRKVFSLSIVIFSGLALLIVFLCETVGLWFFYEKLNIPEGRETAAFWVYQFSVITTALTVICVPYDAIIIAHERMKVFAFVQVLNATLNLGIVYLVAVSPFDKLIVYALLLMLIQVLNRIIYGIYCGKNFPETKFTFIKDRALMKEMTSFAGWSLLGNMIWVGCTQGLNIMLNLFFGTAVNAARGIAVNVQGTINGFVTNFQMAANPQIIKSYAAGDFKRLHSLLFFSSKFSFFLLLLMELPVIIEADMILKLWLGTVPEYTVAFLRISLLTILIEALENPIGVANNATGQIKKFNLTSSSLKALIIVFSYIALRFGYPAVSVFVIQFVVISIVLFVKVNMVKGRIKLSLRQYIYHLVFPILISALVSSVIPISLYCFTEQGVLRLILVLLTSVLSVLITAFFFGLNRSEKQIVIKQVQTTWNKWRKKEA